jgi:23S rRNA pseudouridine2605 synthase
MWKKCSMPQADTAERLQKVLAAAGVGSRRACEDLIFRRRVTVNGRVAKLGDKVDPATAEIHVDGQRVITNTKLVYVALNKPRGVVSSLDDEKGRTELADFLGANFEQRLFHVGRLDAETEGLLLLTNDGELGHRLMHPSFEVQKTYVAEVAGQVPRDLGKRLRAGVTLEDGPVTVDSFRMVDSAGGRSMVELVLHEGRKHVVRRLMDEVGHPVLRLVRTAIGEVQMGGQRPGRIRPLTHPEVGSLYRAVGL